MHTVESQTGTPKLAACRVSVLAGNIGLEKDQQILGVGGRGSAGSKDRAGIQQPLYNKEGDPAVH